jgi:methionine-rich copper-binding protein CopC
VIQVKFRRRSITAAVAVAVVAGIVAAGAALAHTNVAETRPAAGSSVEAAPESVYVRFGEESVPAPAQVTDARLEVFDPCGTQVDKKDSAVNMQESSVTVSSEGARAGRYEVHWHATAADGAVQSGIFDFDVTTGAACTTATRTDPAKDVDLGLDVVSIRAKQARGGAGVTITTAAAVRCATLAPKAVDALNVKVDTNGDAVADIDGRVTCRRGRWAVTFSGESGTTGRISAVRPSATKILFKIPQQLLVEHADIYVEAAHDSDECSEEKKCLDIAPDLGLLRAF